MSEDVEGEENRRGRGKIGGNTKAMSSVPQRELGVGREECVLATLDEIQARAGRMSIPLLHVSAPDSVLQQLLDDSTRSDAAYRYAIVKDLWDALAQFEPLLGPDGASYVDDPNALGKAIGTIAASQRFQSFKAAYIDSLSSAVENITSGRADIVPPQRQAVPDTSDTRLDRLLNYMGSSTGWGLLPPPRKLRKILGILMADTVPKREKSASPHPPRGALPKGGVTLEAKAEALSALHGCSFEEIIALEPWRDVRTAIVDILLSPDESVASVARNFLLHSISPSNSYGYVELLWIYHAVLSRCVVEGPPRGAVQLRQDAHLFTQIITAIPRLWLRYSHGTITEIAGLVISLLVIKPAMEHCVHREVAQLDPYATWLRMWTSTSMGRKAVFGSLKSENSAVFLSIAKHFQVISEKYTEQSALSPVSEASHLDISVVSIICHIVLSSAGRSLFTISDTTGLHATLVRITRLAVLDAPLRSPSPIVATARHALALLFKDSAVGQRIFFNSDAFHHLLAAIPTHRPETAQYPFQSPPATPFLSDKGGGTTNANNQQAGERRNAWQAVLDACAGIIPLLVDIIGVACCTRSGREKLATTFAPVSHFLQHVVFSYSSAILHVERCIPLASGLNSVAAACAEHPQQLFSVLVKALSAYRLLLINATSPVFEAHVSSLVALDSHNSPFGGSGPHREADADADADGKSEGNECWTGWVQAMRAVKSSRPQLYSVYLDALINCASSPLGAWTLLSSADASHLLERLLTHLIANDQVGAYERYGYGCMLVEFAATERGATQLLASSAHDQLLQLYKLTLAADEDTPSPPYCPHDMKARSKALAYLIKVLTTRSCVLAQHSQQAQSRSHGDAVESAEAEQSTIVGGNGKPFSLVPSILANATLVLHYFGSSTQAERDSLVIMRCLLSSLTVTCHLQDKHGIIDRLMSAQPRRESSDSHSIIVSEFSLLRNRIIAHALVVGGPREKSLPPATLTAASRSGSNGATLGTVALITSVDDLPPSLFSKLQEHSAATSDFSAFDSFHAALSEPTEGGNAPEKKKKAVVAAFWELLASEGPVGMWILQRREASQTAFQALVDLFLPEEEEEAETEEGEEVGSTRVRRHGDGEEDDVSADGHGASALPFWKQTIVGYAHRLGYLPSLSPSDTAKHTLTPSKALLQRMLSSEREGEGSEHVVDRALGKWRIALEAIEGRVSTSQHRRRLPEGNGSATSPVSADWFLSCVLLSCGADAFPRICSSLSANKKRLRGVWTALDGGVHMYRAICQQISHACDTHVPLASTAIHVAGLTVSHLCTLWLEQMFLNFADWQQIYIFLCGTVIFGDTFAVAMCCAVLKSLCPLMLETPSASLDVVLRTEAFENFGYMDHVDLMKTVLDAYP